LLRFDSWENDSDPDGNLSQLVEEPAIWNEIFGEDQAGRPIIAGSDTSNR
jgi:hypothetical protein